MHSKAFILSLFAAGALATPLVVYTDYEMATKVETVYVTRTAGYGYPAPTEQPVPVHKPKHHHKHHHKHKHPEPVPEPEPEPAPVKHHHHSGGHHHHANVNPDDYQGMATLHTNLHRANHSAKALSWDSGLAATAQKIASSCVYAHDTTTDGGGYGQNIAAGVAPNNISEIITGMFYNGEVAAYDGCYGQSDPPNFEEWGHFSQIVWKDTTHFACATVDCSGSGLANAPGVTPWFTVCNYKSPGNVAGEYGTQVGASLGHPTIEWNYS